MGAERRWISRSVEETQTIAAQIASQSQAGDLFALYGDLASGKTTFTKGFCRARGVQMPVTSPTFTLINEYQDDIPIYHFDCYRLSDESELYSLGYEEYFFSPGIVLIEWAERAEGLLPPETIRMRFSHRFDEPNSREIIMECTEDRKSLCASLP